MAVGYTSTPSNSQIATGGSGIDTGLLTGYDAVHGNYLDDTPTFSALLERAGNTAPFTTVLRDMGFRYSTHSRRLSHFEVDDAQEDVKVESIVTPAGGAGNTMTVEVETTSVSGSNYSVPIDNETYVANDSQTLFFVQNKNTGVTPHQVDLTPLDSSADLDNLVQANESYGMPSSMHVEAGNMPNFKTEQYFRYENEFQITKTALGFTGTAATFGSFIDFVPTPDGTGNYQILRDMANTTYMNEVKKGNALLFGQENSNNISQTSPWDNVNRTLGATQGLWDFANKEGESQTYTAGQYSIQDFEAMDVYYESQNVDSEFIFSMEGHQLTRQKENVLKEYVDDTSINFQTQVRGRMGVQNSLRAFVKSGRKYVCQKMPEFNNKSGGNNGTYEFPEISLNVPMGMSKDGYDPMQPEEQMPIMGYAYRKNFNNGYEREDVFQYIDGSGYSGRGINDETDATKIGFLSEIAGHFTRGNWIVIQRPQ